MERRKFAGFANSMGEMIVTDGAAATSAGSTKAIEVNRERSESWQQDMAQATIPDIS
jgi:hypothetical protein